MSASLIVRASDATVVLLNFSVASNVFSMPFFIVLEFGWDDANEKKRKFHINSYLSAVLWCCCRVLLYAAKLNLSDWTLIKWRIHTLQLCSSIHDSIIHLQDNYVSLLLCFQLPSVSISICFGFELISDVFKKNCILIPHFIHIQCHDLIFCVVKFAKYHVFLQ